MSSKRVVIVGTSGSGKTTLAKKIAVEYELNHIELDTLYWNPNWTPTPMPEFLGKIERAINQNKSWVICGNYNIAKQITLPHATDIIWLNYPLRVNLWRAFIRSIRRIIKKEEAFAGCSETFSHVFFSKDSILLWILQTHKRRREEFTKLLTNEKFKHANIVVIRNNKEYAQIKL